MKTAPYCSLVNSKTNKFKHKEIAHEEKFNKELVQIVEYMNFVVGCLNLDIKVIMKFLSP